MNKVLDKRKVSANGQFTVPARFRREWGVPKGGLIVSSSRSRAELYLAHGAQYALIEAIFPQSELQARAQHVNFQERLEKPALDNVFKERQLSASGQVVVPISSVRATGQEGPFDVNVREFNNAFIISKDKPELYHDLPMDIVENGDWQAVEPDRLASAYTSWCNDIGHQVLNYALNGIHFDKPARKARDPLASFVTGVAMNESYVPLQSTEASDTLLGQQIITAVIKQGINSALQTR